MSLLRKSVVLLCLAVLLTVALTQAASGLLVAILVPYWFIAAAVIVTPFRREVSPPAVQPLSLFSVAGSRAPPSCS